MHQIIEGIDNEIVFILFFITILLAVVIPLYVMKPNRNLQERRQEDGRSSNINANVDQATNVDSQYSRRQDEPLPTSMPTPEPEPDNISSSCGDTSNDVNEMISVRVLHQETYRQMNINSGILLNNFKEECFPEEFAAQKSIRMIYAGKILQTDTSSLRELGIVNGSVIHCVISEGRTDGRSNEPAAIPNDLDLSDYFMLLVGITLIGTWAIFITSSNIMSVTSIAILGLLTVFFVGMTFYS